MSAPTSAGATPSPNRCSIWPPACIGGTRWYGWPSASLSAPWSPLATRPPWDAAPPPNEPPTAKSSCNLPQATIRYRAHWPLGRAVSGSALSTCCVTARRAAPRWCTVRLPWPWPAPPAWYSPGPQRRTPSRSHPLPRTPRACPHPPPFRRTPRAPPPCRRPGNRAPPQRYPAPSFRQNWTSRRAARIRYRIWRISPTVRWPLNWPPMAHRAALYRSLCCP